jgi:hypothetical protein
MIDSNSMQMLAALLSRQPAAHDGTPHLEQRRAATES